MSSRNVATGERHEEDIEATIGNDESGMSDLQKILQPRQVNNKNNI